MNSVELRPAPRLPLQMDIEFRRSYARRNETGRLKNISLTGAFIEVPNIHELCANDKIIVKIFVSGRERNLQASVVWQNDRGCGIRFKPSNNRDLQIVDDLMYFIETSRLDQKGLLDTIFKKVS